MNTFKLVNETSFPLEVDLGGLDPESFIALFRNNEEQIRSWLLQKGALKFKGLQIESVEIFQKIVDSISSKFLNYIDGNSPRTKLSGTVYTSTEYDKSQRITMHNELSYSAKWPNKLFFSCLTPAATGGETLLADSREVLKNLDQDIVSEIRKRGIIYIRNLHGGKGIGQSWQDTFETNDKEKVEEYCKAYSIEFEWREDDNLRLKQFSKGIIRHRETKEEVWFNQMDQFHPSQLGEETYEAMMTIYESPEEFPIYVTFGDGGEIDMGTIKRLMQKIEEITFFPPWQINELLIVDNELVCHGRNSFTGDRKVLVAMSE